MSASGPSCLCRLVHWRRGRGTRGRVLVCGLRQGSWGFDDDGAFGGTPDNQTAAHQQPLLIANHRSIERSPTVRRNKENRRARQHFKKRVATSPWRFREPGRSLSWRQNWLRCRAWSQSMPGMAMSNPTKTTAPLERDWIEAARVLIKMMLFDS